MIADYISTKGSAEKASGTGHPKEFTPEPTDQDYLDGFITRYFAVQKRKPRKIIEISKRQFETHDKLFKGLSNELYDVFTIDWKITGPKNDIIKNGIPVRNGVEDSNRRRVELEEEDWSGLSEVLNDPLEFWEER